MGGWIRIGIVLSVVWALVGGFWAHNSAGNEVQRRTGAQFDVCVAINKARLGDAAPYDQISKPCRDQFPNNYLHNIEGFWWGVAFVALVPIPVAWIIIYMLTALYRWIRRGFVEAA